jgi:hypothetical protein
MLRNIRLIDYVVSGELRTKPYHFEVFIHIVANAKSFSNYLIELPTDFNLVMYNHVKAYKNNQCFLSPTIMEKTHVKPRRDQSGIVNDSAIVPEGENVGSSSDGVHYTPEV